MCDLGTTGTAAGEARIVGNLAGVVEWANDAFARLSGIALDDMLNKPIGRLLDHAGIDLEIVEFVAQHFFEGRVCRVAFPFERPDGRRIDVLLEVEALRDGVGEIDRFVAIAREGPAAADALAIVPPAAASASVPAIASACVAAGVHAVDLNAAVRRGLDAVLGAGAGASRVVPRELEYAVELDLEPDLGRAIAVSNDVDALVTGLFEAARRSVEEAGNAGGVITLSTAHLPAHRRFVSKVHAVPACPPERSEPGDLVLEIHDTGLALPPALVAALASGHVGSTGELGAAPVAASARGLALAEACALARRLGARVHLDSTPGCGTQLLALFAPAPAPSATAAQAR